MKTDHVQMRLLCEDINLPNEITGRILQIIADCDFTDIDDYFSKLFSLETGDEAYKKIVSALKENERGLKPLAIYLSAAVTTWELYKKLGIPRLIYIDTMKMFSRFVHEHFETYGFYGFDRDFWIHRILSASLFRLGTLEFEMGKCTNNMLLDYASDGEKIISVHIPSDANMTRENLNKSYEMAKHFFSKYFPDYGNKIFYCSTWLLDPLLKDLLPVGSRILEFQLDYKIIKGIIPQGKPCTRRLRQLSAASRGVLNPSFPHSLDHARASTDAISLRSSIKTSLEDSEFITWVYKKKYDSYTTLPENTTLQKNMKKYLLSGGRISLVTGIKI